MSESVNALKEATKKAMEGSKAHLVEEFKKLRTGRATTTALEGILIDYYGTMTPLKSMGALSTPEARTVTVTPFDSSAIQNIEKGLRLAGHNPMCTDGKVIRVPFPPMTEETRKQVVKQAEQEAEKAKISVRNHRKEANGLLEKAVKNKLISEDEQKTAEKAVQKLTDDFCQEIETLLKKKAEEIMTI